MRLRRWWRRATFSAAMLLSGSVAAAQGQETYATAPNPAEIQSADAATQAADVRVMIERLDREVQSLRSQLDQQRQTPAQPAANVADAAADAAQDKKSPLKKVEIISKPVMVIQGRMFFDQIMYEDDPALVAATGVDRLNETGFNTVRLGCKGTIYENVTYDMDVEFEGTETNFKDIYVELLNAPYLGTVRVGHFKEFISLEEITSSRFITFMQRSSAHGAFVPSRNFGIMAYNYILEDDNWSWYVGTFRHDSPDNPTGRASHIADEGDWVADARVAGLLWYDEPSQGRYLAHVGGSFSARNDLTVASFANRPELGSQAGYLTSTFTGDDTWNLYGLEFAVVWGVQSLQAEYYLADVDGGENSGGYVEYSYFLTGENRAYRKDRKCFDRVKVIEDFFRVSTAEGVCMGHGTWQLAVRYSWCDQQEGVVGVRGEQNDFSAGVNWYWNNYTRMMFDYVYEDVSLITGVNGFNNNFGMRFQVDW